MSEFRQAEQLKAFADEIFEASTAAWKAQSRERGQLETELSETEFLALDILADSDKPRTVGEIQREIGVLPAQMSRVVRALEHKGNSPLVRCSINAADKRKVDVELTEAGRRVHRAYRQIKLGTIQDVLEKLGSDDRNEFMRILRLMRKIIHNSSLNKGLGAEKGTSKEK